MNSLKATNILKDNFFDREIPPSGAVPISALIEGSNCTHYRRAIPPNKVVDVHLLGKSKNEVTATLELEVLLTEWIDDKTPALERVNRRVENIDNLAQFKKLVRVFIS